MVFLPGANVNPPSQPVLLDLLDQPVAQDSLELREREDPLDRTIIMSTRPFTVLSRALVA